MEMLTTVDMMTGLVLKIDWKPAEPEKVGNVENDKTIRDMMKKGGV